MALTKIGRLLDKGVIKDQTNLGASAADTDEYLLYDASADSLKAIAASNVTPNETLITGKTALGAGAATNDQILIFDTSASVLKKVTQQNLLNFPNITSVTPTNAISGDGTGNYTFVIAGTGFTGASASLINNSGGSVSFDTTSVDSDSQITGVIAKSSLPGTGEPYDIRVSAASGLASTLENQINVDQQPVYSTAAGSLGTVTHGARTGFTTTVVAADPESGGDVVYTLESGSLPAGASLTSTSSGAVISGNLTAVGSNTTSNFTIRAKDVNSNTSDRAFSITVNAAQYQSFTSSGTFSVPSGVSVVDVLVVAGGGGGGSQHGGGGGAGGLIYRPAFTVTPGGTVSVTVGDGAAGDPGSDGGTDYGSTGQDSVFGTLTAKGGGGGTGWGNPGSGQAGGSGGGSSGPSAVPSPAPGIQPTQPGESGNYGFGNPGGNVGGGQPGGGGGGGGGATGGNGQDNSGVYGGAGGVGKAYTIADGTTSVFYAGGGGGGAHLGSPEPAAVGGTGGQGGGGDGGKYFNGSTGGQSGTANRGGGGGGSGAGEEAGGTGGKGIVIVQY